MANSIEIPPLNLSSLNEIEQIDPISVSMNAIYKTFLWSKSKEYYSSQPYIPISQLIALRNLFKDFNGISRALHIDLSFIRRTSVQCYDRCVRSRSCSLPEELSPRKLNICASWQRLKYLQQIKSIQFLRDHFLGKAIHRDVFSNLLTIFSNDVNQVIIYLEEKGWGSSVPTRSRRKTISLGTIKRNFSKIYIGNHKQNAENH